MSTRQKTREQHALDRPQTNHKTKTCAKRKSGRVPPQETRLATRLPLYGIPPCSIGDSDGRKSKHTQNMKAVCRPKENLAGNPPPLRRIPPRSIGDSDGLWNTYNSERSAWTTTQDQLPEEIGDEGSTVHLSVVGEEDTILDTRELQMRLPGVPTQAVAPVAATQLPPLRVPPLHHQTSRLLEGSAISAHVREDKGSEPSSGLPSQKNTQSRPHLRGRRIP